MANGIQDKVVAITGASSGIGRTAALLFARRGASLVLMARRRPALESLAEECRRVGGLALVAPLDVTDGAALQQVVVDAAAAFGRIDAWINNAAVLMVGKFLDCPPEAYRRVMEVNLFGYINGARAVLPQFKAQGRGILVNVTSLGSKVGTPYQSAYSASKFAVAGWAEALRLELYLEKARDIQVCNIVPGFIDTPLFQHAANYTGRAVKPVRPVHAPEQVARAMLRAVVSPRREIIVGIPARLAMVSHALAPDLAGKAMARTVERHHLAADPAPATDGNVLEPLAGGATSSGGWREEDGIRPEEAGGLAGSSA